MSADQDREPSKTTTVTGSGTGLLVAVVGIGERRLSLHTVRPGGRVDGDPRSVDLSAVPGQPHEVRFDPHRRVLYVSHTYLGGWYLVNDGPAHHISVVDVDTFRLIDAIDLSTDSTDSGGGVGPAPAHGAHDLWVDAARDRIWASVEAAAGYPGSSGLSGGLVGIDPQTGRRVAYIEAGARAAHWFAVVPDGTRAYTANKEAPFVSVLDLEAAALVGRVPVPGSEGIAAGPDGRVFVAGPCRLPGLPDPSGSCARHGVRVIDSRTDEVVELLETDHAPGAVHVTAGGLLLVAEMRVATGTGPPAEGMLHIVDAATLRHLGQVPIGASVLTMTSTPSDGDGFAFVADAHGGQVTIVDLTERRAVSTISGTPGAHGLAVIPT